MGVSTIFHLPNIVNVRKSHGAVIAAYVDKEYVFQYCLSGEVNFRLRNQLYHVTPGTAFLMPPQLPHAVQHISSQSDYSYIVIHFTLPAESTLLKLFPLAVGFPEPDAFATAEKLHMLCREWNNRQSGYKYIMSGLLMELLGLFWRNRGVSLQPDIVISTTWRNVERVISWMHRQYSKPLSIEQMSRHANLSTAYFCRAFKEYTGSSPHEYLNNIRIAKAIQLLMESECNCTQTADAVGFPTVAAFSRAFKRVMRVSPSRWIQDNHPNA